MCAGEVEFRSLAAVELAVCTEAARPGGLRLRDADADLIEALHKRGLLYLEVPIRPDDHVSIPPLEARAPSIHLLPALLLRMPISSASKRSTLCLMRDRGISQE